MTPDESEVRRALEARSGEVSPEFRARLSGTLQGGRPAVNAIPAAAAAMAVILALGSVGVLLMARGVRHVSYGGPVSGTQYTVVTSLMSAKGGPLNACYATPLPNPPIGCGGVEVSNVDVAAIPGVVTYKNGTVSTPVVMLVGTWDGRALNLTEQPRQTTLKGTQPQPIAQAPPPSNGKPVAQVLDELRRDSDDLRKRGIVMLTWGQAKDSAEVTLAVADPKSVQYMYDKYGRMRILGWLQPVNRPLPTPTIIEKTPIAVPLFNQLSAPSGNVVWAWVPLGRLYRSTDRGNTWEERALPPIQAVGNPDFSFLNAQEGWFLIGGAEQPQCFEGRAQIWHTTDGAATWQRVAVEMWTLSFTSDSVGGETCKQGISFSDPLHGYVSAWGANRHPIIYRTLDGGRHWAGATLTDPPGFVTQMGANLRLGPVRAFGSTLLVYAWGDLVGEWMPTSVYVFRSTDGGSTWSYLARNLDFAFHTVTFVTTSRWLQIGNQGSDQETTDAGKTWHPFTSDYVAAAGVPDVIAFGDELVGYSTNRGGIYRTVDGGAHWVTIATPGAPNPGPIPMPSSAQLSASGNAVWALVASAHLFRSTDRGNTWEQRPLPVSQPGVSPEISFVDGQQGWYSTSSSPETQCNGQETVIWHTTDGGATWQPVANSGMAITQCKAGLSFIDPIHGFLGAWDQNHRPTIYRSSDGGRSWAGATLPDPPGFVTQAGGVSLRAGLVKGFGSTLLVTAGWSGQGDQYVFRSTDGGASWTYVATTSNSTVGVTFVTATRWLKIGNDSSGLETTDAGKTWHTFITDYADAAGVASLFVFGDDTVGYGTVRGGIHRTVDGGSHWMMIKNAWP